MPTSTDVLSSIGISNLPNQLHRIIAKKGIYFNILLLGESGTGKTTFLNTLLSTSLLSPPAYHTRFDSSDNVSIKVTDCVLEERTFSVNVSVIECKGFGDSVDNSFSWAPAMDYVDQAYQLYMRGMGQPNRKNMVDKRVHCCIYFISPGHNVKELDVMALKELGERVNVIPVIAKADTLSVGEKYALKERVRRVLEENGIKVFVPPFDEDEESVQHAVLLQNAMPFAVVASEEMVQVGGKQVLGRAYPWGVVEVENPEHSDFHLIRSMVVRRNLLDLIEKTEDFYEAFRERAGNYTPESQKLMSQKMKEEEDALRRKFTEQVKMEEARFRQWENKLIAERDRLNKDLETEHAYIKQLEGDVDGLSKRK